MAIGFRNDRGVLGALRAFSNRCVPLLMLALATCGASLGASGRVINAPPLPQRSLDNLGWAIADFDGDSQPDLAITKSEARGSGYVYWLELDLSARPDSKSPQTLPGLPALSSPVFGLHLTPRDVDGDHDLDIVLTVGVARQPVAVWINDGQGGFEEGDPAAYPAWVWLENFPLSPSRQSESAQMAWNIGRRSPSGLLADSDLIQPVLRAAPGPVRPPEQGFSRLRADRRPARAPPAHLSFPS
jgi:FG-GAP-like repeat